MLKKNKIHILMQARTNSSRLQSKSLMPIGKTNLVNLCFLRVYKKNNFHYRILTSSSYKDNSLVSFLKKKKIPFFRGNLNNVLKRYYIYTRKFSLNDIIVRLTADNPAVDYLFLLKCLKIYKKFKLDYFSSHHNVKNIPYGLSVEIFRVKHLKEVFFKNSSNFEKEHVTPKIRDKYLVNKEFFSISKNSDLKNTKISIDTISDYNFVSNFFKKNNKISYKKICQLLLKKIKDKNIY